MEDYVPLAQYVNHDQKEMRKATNEIKERERERGKYVDHECKEKLENIKRRRAA